MNRNIATAALVVLSLILGSLWLRAHDAQARATAELVKRDATLDSMAHRVEQAERIRQVERRRTDSLLALSRDAVARDSALADSLRAMVTVRYVELRGALPNDLRPTLDSLVQTFAQERDAQQSIIVQLNADRARLLEERTESDRLLSEYQAALTLALSQRDGWKKVSTKRDWLACGPMVGLGLHGATAGAGCVLNLF